MDFIFTYSPFWILLALLIAFIYAFVLYQKDALLAETSKKLKLILGSFRFVSVFLIVILLLGIILENFNSIQQKPLIFIAKDNSESVINSKDSSFYKQKFIDDLKKLSANLNEDYDVIEYSFSEVLENGIQNTYNGKSTNISRVFDQIYDQYTNNNIGAIVLASDGMYNTGVNPIYSVDRQAFVPVYTIGLGDTNRVKDFKITNVYNNDIAFLGNTFPVEVILSTSQIKNQKAKIQITSADKIVHSENIEIIEDQVEYKLNFELTANKLGLVKYTVQIENLDGEYTYKNNQANFYIDVIDGRQKIAMLYSGAHPDLGAMSYVINNNKNYEVEQIKYKDFESATGYDLLICHAYNGENNNLNELIKSGKKPVLMLVGVNANFGALNNINIGFSGRSTSKEDVQMSVNGNFEAIQFSPNMYQMLSDAPPLQVPFGNFDFAGGLDVMSYQKVGNVALESPLVYFSQKNGNRYGVIMGEGIWRWRLFDQQKNNSTANFEEFISKTISYLALKENKKKFIVSVDKEYLENQNVVISAELYNNTYDLINTPDVEFVLTNDKNEVFNYEMFKTSNAYKLELGKLKQGIYHWQATTVFDNTTYKDEGDFIVKEMNIEWTSITANHRLLNNISQNTGGRFYLPKQLNELEVDIKSREDIVTTSYNEKSFDDLIDYKWLFFLIMILISVEWFIRKYNGAY